MDVRCASVSLAAVVALGACATNPPRLPPHRPVAAQVEPAPPSTTVARAPDLAMPTAPPIRHVRYAWATLLADAASIVPLVYWMVEPDKVYYPIPALVLTPLIHTAYGQPDKAVTSLVLRGAMVAVVYAVGRRLEDGCGDSDGFVCVPTGSLLLANVAITSVVVIDAAFLARATRVEGGWHRLPVVSLTGGAGGQHGLALTGRF